MADKTNDTTTGSNTQAADAAPLIRPIGEVHDELIAERDKQAAFNAQQHAIQAEQANRFNNLSKGYVVQPPDDARAEALDRQKAEADLTATGTAADTAKYDKKPTAKSAAATDQPKN